MEPVIHDEDVNNELPPEPLNLPVPTSSEPLVWKDINTNNDIVSVNDDNQIL